MKRNMYGMMLSGAVLAFSVVLVGCGKKATQTDFTPPEPCDKSTDVAVNIKFEKGCPKSVDKGNELEKLVVGKNDRICWQAVDSDGSAPEYDIFFDPFKGDPLDSNKAERRSPKFDGNTPEVEYKYTIVGTKCQDPDKSKRFLDPRFRLR